MSNANATIVRAPHDRTNPYKMVRQATFEDNRLSWEARGVLAYLLVKPDDWQVQVSGLRAAGDIGKDKVYRILNELMEVGYLERVEERETGRFGGLRYLLHEEPIAVLSDTENSDTVITDTENTDHTKYEHSTKYEYPTKNETTTTTEPAASSSGPEGAPEFGAIIKCWQENMPGTMTPIIGEELGDLCDTFGAEETIRAIITAVKAGVRTMRYVSGILRKRANGQDESPPGSHVAPAKAPRVIQTPTLPIPS